MNTGFGRFLYPEGVVPHGPWFACSKEEAVAIRKWAKLEWKAGTVRPQ